jgi:hypothetical protein
MCDFGIETGVNSELTHPFMLVDIVHTLFVFFFVNEYLRQIYIFWYSHYQ